MCGQMDILERSGRLEGQDWRGGDQGGQRYNNKVQGGPAKPPALYFTLPACHCSVALTLNHSCSARTILIPFLCILLPAVPSAQNAPAAHIFTVTPTQPAKLISFELFQEALLVWGRGTPRSSRPRALALSQHSLRALLLSIPPRD